jgi:hypothetical protein
MRSAESCAVGVLPVAWDCSDEHTPSEVMSSNGGRRKTDPFRIPPHLGQLSENDAESCGKAPAGKPVAIEVVRSKESCNVFQDEE